MDQKIKTFSLFSKENLLNEKDPFLIDDRSHVIEQIYLRQKLFSSNIIWNWDKIIKESLDKFLKDNDSVQFDDLFDKINNQHKNIPNLRQIIESRLESSLYWKWDRELDIIYLREIEMDAIRFQRLINKAKFQNKFKQTKLNLE